jgi:hypothetical protein
MRRLAPRSLALLLVALPWLAACAGSCAPDIKGTAGADAGAPAPSASPAREDSPLPLALRPVTDLRPAEGGLHADAPPLTDVAAWLQAELSKAPELAASGDEGRPSARLSGDYRAAWSPAQDGSPGNLGAVYFELTLRTASPKGRPLDIYRASAFVGERLPDDKPPAEGLKLLVQGVTQEVAATLIKQLRAQHADDPTTPLPGADAPTLPRKRERVTKAPCPAPTLSRLRGGQAARLVTLSRLRGRVARSPATAGRRRGGGPSRSSV